MTEETDVVNEWVDAKMHPITGMKEINTCEGYSSNPAKKRKLYVQYDYQLPLNLIKQQ